MLRLMIADDEEDVRDGMRDCIDWAGNGLIVTGTAADGPSAYEMIIKDRPDIVLIDIQMPGMSGLAVIDRIRSQHNIKTVFIILSGYDDFSYAQKAIRLQVEEYLLKPCSPDDVLRAVRKAIERMDAVRALGADSATGDDFVSFYSRYMEHSVDPGERRGMRYPAQQERGLVNLIQVGTEDEALTALDAFLDAVTRENESKGAVINCCVMAYMEIYRLLMDRGLEGAFNYSATVSWNDEDVLASLRRSLCETVMTAFERLNNQKEANSPVAKAVKYIDENYARELNLEMVAQEVYVTPSYLSGLFKQSMGLSFVDYIQRVRIEKAKELLASGFYKKYEVAQRVGYSCDKYFSQVFKKCTGMTPSQFKEQTGTGR